MFEWYLQNWEFAAATVGSIALIVAGINRLLWWLYEEKINEKKPVILKRVSTIVVIIAHLLLAFLLIEGNTLGYLFFLYPVLGFLNVVRSLIQMQGETSMLIMSLERRIVALEQKQKPSQKKKK